MGWGFGHMQREGAGEGGSVYLRLSTRTLDQPQRIMTPDLQKGITDGAYWLRKPGAELRSGDRLYRRGGAGSDRGRRADRRKPPGCRPARHHLRRPAACGLDRGAKPAPRPPRADPSQPHRKTAGAAAARLRHRHRDRRSSGDPGLARQRARPPRRSARCRAFRPDRHHSTTSIATTASTPTPSSTPPKASPWGRRCGTAKWRCDFGKSPHLNTPPQAGEGARCDMWQTPCINKQSCEASGLSLRCPRATSAEGPLRLRGRVGGGGFLA